MSKKRRHDEREARREAILRQAKIDALARGERRRSKLRWLRTAATVSLISWERGHYVDEPFVCQGCGTSQIWTAAQQKWWYEVAKGSVFSTARLCRSCRQQERALTGTACASGSAPQPVQICAASACQDSL